MAAIVFLMTADEDLRPGCSTGRALLALLELLERDAKYTPSLFECGYPDEACFGQRDSPEAEGILRAHRCRADEEPFGLHEH